MLMAVIVLVIVMPVIVIVVPVIMRMRVTLHPSLASFFLGQLAPGGFDQPTKLLSLLATFGIPNTIAVFKPLPQ